MNIRDFVGLLVLAAIWGGSFISMRVLVPPLGSVLTAAARALIAGVVLSAYFAIIRHDAEWRRFWKHYLVIGFINSALPFALFGFAANHLPAAYSAILNSTSPFFGAVLSALWLAEPLTGRKVAGLLCGTAGVVAVAGGEAASPIDGWFGVAIAGCLVAALCYAVSAVYIKKVVGDVKPMSIAGATQLAAGLMLLPAILVDPPAGPVTAALVVHLVIFALLCSGVAFLIYFRPIARIGPTRALTVTFLMPPFGIVFAALFLGEPITIQSIVGCSLVIAGTVMVLRKERAPDASLAAG